MAQNVLLMNKTESGSRELFQFAFKFQA